MKNMTNSPTALPAATILLVRDGADGLEVFMVKRHHQIDFISGALVFPGGKVDSGDSVEGIEEFLDGIDGLGAAACALAVAAVREAFEESGILLARDATTRAFVDATRLEELSAYRAALEKREVPLVEVLRRERLRLALDQLVPFAHWITPEHMHKRFDTHFFIAPSPVGHAGRHDGRESVDSLWVTPKAALADRERWTIIFPTKLNLMKLGGSTSVADALAHARSNPPVTVMPVVEDTPNGKRLRIRADAGYTQTTAKFIEGN